MNLNKIEHFSKASRIIIDNRTLLMTTIFFMQPEVVHYGNIKFDVIAVKDYNKIGIIIKQPNEKNLST